jgi:hypothetical protein
LAGNDGPVLTGINVASPPTKTAYTAGEAFSSAGLVVSAAYSDGNADEEVTDYTLTWNGAALAEGSTAITAGTGTKTITVTYEGKTAGFAITVRGAGVTVASIAVASPPAKTAYTAGEAFSSTGLVVSAAYNDGSTDKEVTGYTLTWNNAVLTEGSAAITAETGTKTITVTYGGQTVEFAISVGDTNPSPSEDTTPPAEITGLAAAAGIGSVTLSWTDSADADLGHFEITWTGGNATAAKSAAANRANSKTLTGLTGGNAYTFTVKAVDASGNKSQGETVTAAPVDMSAGTTITIASAEDWANARTQISTGGNGTISTPKIYTLDIPGAVSVPGVSSSENTISGNYKIVRLTGSGNLSLSGPGSIFRIGNSNQTLIIDGPTLTGRTNNNAPLVYAGDGMVELWNGTISGNTATSGGGVYVGNGTFTMTGGTISGNTSSYSFPLTMVAAGYMLAPEISPCREESSAVIPPPTPPTTPLTPSAVAVGCGLWVEPSPCRRGPSATIPPPPLPPPTPPTPSAAEWVFTTEPSP